MIGKRRFAWRHGEETVSELLCGDMSAHALAQPGEGGPLRRTHLVLRNFRKMSNMFVLRHNPSSVSVYSIYYHFTLPLC
jgi:hypothetical protein